MIARRIYWWAFNGPVGGSREGTHCAMAGSDIVHSE